MPTRELYVVECKVNIEGGLPGIDISRHWFRKSYSIWTRVYEYMYVDFDPAGYGSTTNISNTTSVLESDFTQIGEWFNQSLSHRLFSIKYPYNIAIMTNYLASF